MREVIVLHKNNRFRSTGKLGRSKAKTDFEIADGNPVKLPQGHLKEQQNLGLDQNLASAENKLFTQKVEK